MARIMREGKKYQKNFPAKKCGGWRKAKALALEWVVEMKKILPEKPQSTFDKMSSKNTSGVVGVTIRSVYVTRPNGNKYHYWSWVAKWPNCKYSGGVRFNVGSKWSDEDAFTLAVLARRMQVEDREQVIKKFNQIKGRKTHEEILSKKMLYLDWE